MTEKEFRKLRAKDLVQLLLTQGGEASQLQEQIDQKEQELAVLLENNDLLKGKLDERDEYIENLKKDLDFRDSHIKNLEAEMEALRNDLWIDMQEIGTLTDAGKLISEIFEMTQREANQHIKYAREQGIDPAKVRIAKPAMPMTVMPTSVPRGSAAPSAGAQHTAAAAKRTENITEFSKKTPTKAAKAEAKAPKAAVPIEKAPSAISRFAAESKAAFESDQTVSAIDRLAQAKAKAEPKPEAQTQPESMIQAQPESKAQTQPESKIQAQPEPIAETPDRLAKAAWAAAAAIEESPSAAKAGRNGFEIPGVDPGAVIPPAEESAGSAKAQTADAAQVKAQTAGAAQAEAPSAAKPGTETGKGKRRGLFGLFRFGKHKSRQDVDSYESSPLVARMKN